MSIMPEPPTEVRQIVAPRRPGSTPAGALDRWGNTTSNVVLDRKDHPPTLQAPPIAAARAALVDARRYRAEHLVAVAEGLLSPLDVIAQATTAEGKPLRRVSLRQLLLSQPGWGRRRTDRVLSGLAARIGPGADESPTIAWLIDPRAGGKRLLAWLDVHQEKKTPWPGFPFTSYRGGQP